MLNLVLAIVVLASPGFDQTHGLFDQVLKEVVSDGRVDYRKLKANPKKLNDYIKDTSSVSKETFSLWNESQQIAFLINVYNAETLQLIIDHYPVDSIKDIGGFFRSPWKKKVVLLFGKKEHLDHVEHEILRKDYSEPRVHFALVCASIGCPELAQDAFVGEQLSQQLDVQGKKYFSRKDINRIDAEARTIYLSKIFDWFKEDFGDIYKFVDKYFADGVDPSFRIRYSSYDWSLNDIERLP